MVAFRLNLVGGFAICLFVLDVFLFVKLNEEFVSNKILSNAKENLEHEWHICEATLERRQQDYKKLEHEYDGLKNRTEALKKSLSQFGCATESRTNAAAEQLVQNHLRRQQLPPNCKDADLRFLICDMSQAHSTGFGCQLHHFAMCLVTGWASNRTVVFDFNGKWSYSSKSKCEKKVLWECFFQPISSCTLDDVATFGKVGWSVQSAANREIKVVHLSFRQSMMTYREWIPPELESVLSFHKRPQIWYVGQIIKFLLRMNEKLESAYQLTKNHLFGEVMPSPLLSIHARGDDSKVEREMLYLDAYMEHIPKGYTTIFLATDDKTNLEIASRYTNYTWIKNIEGDKVFGLQQRYEEGALERLIFDIHLLSEGDHFIGSDGSQISRAVYELMQTKHLDASDKGWSINTIKKDQQYYFFWFFI